MKSSRLTVALFAALVLVASCTRTAREAPKEAPVFSGAPVFVIVIDTLRSDRLPFYGYKGVETPALSALRQDSILFEKAYSHVPLTLPAHASLFTGTLPAAHGVLDNGGYRLGASVPTLAEILKKNGYATGAAVSTIVLAASSGISRGFESYDDAIEPAAPGLAANRVTRPAAETTGILTLWLDGTRSEKVFGFLHFYEPHAPYEPPEPFKSRFPDPYDGEVATADASVGVFVDHIKKKGLYDRSLIIFLSDHGEGLGEHGESEHGVFVYRESIQVPLLVKLPAGAGGRPAFAGSSVSTPVQLIDVFPTIVKTLGIPQGPSPGEAVSLADLAAGTKTPERRIFAETFFPRIRFGWSELRTILDGRWQYIEAPKPEFYDLVNDPASLRNLAEEKPDPLRSMKVELEKRKTAFKAPEAVDEEQAKKLASLGYLSMASAPTGGALPDPKDEVVTLERLKEGLALSKAGRLAESAEVFQKLLEKNPRLVDAWEGYAQVLVQAGRPEEAMAAIRKTVELSPPDRTNYLISVANVCLQVGKPDDAIKHASLAVERGDTNGYEVLARAYLTKNDLANASAQAKKSIETRKTRKRSYLILAEVEARRGNFKEAFAITEEVRKSLAGKEAGDLAGYHLLRGNLLGQLQRFPEAEAEFRKEIELFPRGLPAWQTLSLFLASQRRLPEARETVEKMVQSVDSPAAYGAAMQTLGLIGDQAGAEAYRARAVKAYPQFASAFRQGR